MEQDEDQTIPPEAVVLLQEYVSQSRTELRRFDSEFFDKIANAKWPQTLELTITYVLERFDKQACVLSPFSGAPQYEKRLEHIKANSLDFASSVLRHLDSETRNDILSALDLKLTAKILRLLPGTNDAERYALEMALKDDLTGTQAAAAGKTDKAFAAEEKTDAPATSVSAQGALAGREDMRPAKTMESAPSTKYGPPRRTPDLKSSRERIELVETLARELALIKKDIKGYSTVVGLKHKYPDFKLWTLIENSQISELVAGEEFSPRAYAANLALAKYGLTSWQTLKKDRRKLRAKKSL